MQSSRLNVRFFAHLTLTYFNITSVYLAYQPMNNWKYATKNVHASSKLEKLLYVLTSCYMSFHLIIFRGSMHSMQFSWFFHFSYCFLFALHFFFFFFRLNLFQLPNSHSQICTLNETFRWFHCVFCLSIKWKKHLFFPLLFSLYVWKCLKRKEIIFFYYYYLRLLIAKRKMVFFIYAYLQIATIL